MVVRKCLRIHGFLNCTPVIVCCSCDVDGAEWFSVNCKLENPLHFLFNLIVAFNIVFTVETFIYKSHSV